jgi:hypothetical protein
LVNYQSNSHPARRPIVPQSTRRGICAKVKAIRESDVLPFHDILDATMVKNAVAAEGVSFNCCLYTPMVTLCMFLSQVLDPDHSCRAAVARLIVWLAVNRRRTCSADTSTYCEARQRLPLGVVVRLVHEVADETDAAAPQEWLWNGHRVTLVDGTTVSMPDTVENQKEFPQSPSQAKGLGFPLARIVGLISLSTGVAHDLAMGPYVGKETGETALFRALWGRLQAGEIVLGDRYFASFFGIAGLKQRGVESLFRMHQLRKCDFRRGRRLGVEDHVVTWTKPQRPDWMDQATYAQFPEQLVVRELRIKVAQPGFRVNELVLVTTLLDGGKYTKAEVADLFLRRWDVELDLRSIKCVMQMEILRCKTPEMVRKEIWMHMLAYNLIRGVMAKAAKEHGEEPRHLSFKGTLQTMTAFQDALRRATSRARDELMKEMLGAIAQHRVADRPGRCEPRANKRRPKPTRFLMEPRREARKQLLQAA